MKTYSKEIYLKKATFPNLEAEESNLDEETDISQNNFQQFDDIVGQFVPISSAVDDFHTEALLLSHHSIKAHKIP